MIKKIAKVMAGIGETKFTCKRCGKVWYVPVKDMRKLDKDKKELKNKESLAKSSGDLAKFTSFSPSKHRQIDAEVAQIQAAKHLVKEYDCCPECGSKSVEREYVE